MSKFKIVNRIIDGKNVEVEIGNNTLQYVLTNRLTPLGTMFTAGTASAAARANDNTFFAFFLFML